MYQLKFLNPIEVRMGSPFNVADVVLTGGYVPLFEGLSFQDKGTLSSDGRTCYLIEWKSLPENKPGFRVWKISNDDRTVKKSEIIEGCCEMITSIANGVSLTVFRGGKVENLQVEGFN